MRLSLRDTARLAKAVVRGMRPPAGATHAGRVRSTITARSLAVAVVLGAAIAISAAPAMAATSSHNVALIPTDHPVPPAGINGQDGNMPISSYVSGRPDESFAKFSFSDLALNQITPANLSRFDTVALIEVNVSELSTDAKAALAQFVANGGKLLIHDADETHLNDYSWLLPGSYSTQDGAGCPNCGLTAGTTKITENSGLISGNPADPNYVNLPELQQYTDAVGDANLLVSDDPRWFAAVSGTNGRNEAGAQLAYASNNGLIVFNGFDTDMIKPTATSPWRCVGTPTFQCVGSAHPSVDWLAQMWYAELNKSWAPASSGSSQGNNGLPQSNPVTGIGTPISPVQAGLPSSKRCVAKRTLFLRLRNLIRHHRQVVQIDVYVNGRHVIRERGHWHNVTLRRLPKKGSVVVKVVATTNRRYHLVSRVRYHAC